MDDVISHVNKRGVMYSRFTTPFGYDMEASVWETACIVVGEDACREYMNSLTRHIFAVRAFAEKYYPQISYLTDIHDHSKISKYEFEPYARHFFGITYGASPDRKSYEKAWEHHYTMNPHHWQFWKEGTIPEHYVLEMIADWHGAAYAYGGKWDISGWMNDSNYDGLIQFSVPANKAAITQQLFALGYRKNNQDMWELNKRL